MNLDVIMNIKELPIYIAGKPILSLKQSIKYIPPKYKKLVRPYDELSPGEYSKWIAEHESALDELRKFQCSTKLYNEDILRLAWYFAMLGHTAEKIKKEKKVKRLIKWYFECEEDDSIP